MKEKLEKKAQNKEKLRKEFGLEKSEAPLIGMITRLVDQKGLDLVYEIFDYIVLLGAQFIVLGTGDPKYEEMFKEMEKKYGWPSFDRELVNAPIKSELGKKYLSAMNCAANFAFANKQVITHNVGENLKHY